jgi:membrane protease YdiL (CAAX protease family)
MKKFVLFLIPIIGLIIAGSCIAVFIAPMSPGLTRAILTATLGIIFSLLLFYFIEFIFRKASINKIIGIKLRNIFFGLILGLAVSFFCGIGFLITHNYTIQWLMLVHNLHIRILNNISPALLEEIVFRHGIVHAGYVIFGEKIALILGSIPFGLLHLIGIFFGQPVGMLQVIGISLGGLLLSYTYIEWGLGAVVGLHLIWNTFSVQWSEAFGIDIKSGPAQIEGSFSTIVILALTCLIFIIYRNRKKS